MRELLEMQIPRTRHVGSQDWVWGWARNPYFSPALKGILMDTACSKNTLDGYGVLTSCQAFWQTPCKDLRVRPLAQPGASRHQPLKWVSRGEHLPRKAEVGVRKNCTDRAQTKPDSAQTPTRTRGCLLQLCPPTAQPQWGLALRAGTCGPQQLVLVCWSLPVPLTLGRASAMGLAGRAA